MWVTRAVSILCAWYVAVSAEWRCPALSTRPSAECSCDLPHTLRCTGDHTALQIIGRHLREEKARNKNSAISLLDCALRGVTVLSSAAVGELAGVGLHGLVISSGDIRRVQQGAFSSMSSTIIALGLPNNQMPSIPTEALIKLQKLDRLDLSNNKIFSLEANSFKGITNLSYLDLSDNQLADISSDAFKPLIKLSVLRLRGNLLKVGVLANLKEAHMLKDLDLSGNALEGPLGPNTVPPLSSLTTLTLSDNTFASIRRGTLSGLTNLTHLNIHNNQIDVLEDYAFKHLTNLSHLDLSHNEIVAVSGASLARLTNLVHLDLSHNFLRSLSAEPLKSLEQLTELLLHDNDISMIDDGALALHKDLTRFTIEDNPLNCDCLMAGFARWLREANKLPQTDKSAAECSTPPHLEGALLSRLSKSKLCDDGEHIELKSKEMNYASDGFAVNSIRNDVKMNKASMENGEESEENTGNRRLSHAAIGYQQSQVINDAGEGGGGGGNDDGLDDDLYDQELDIPSEEDLPMSKSTLHLIEAWHANEEVYLSWVVDPPSYRFRCTGVTVSRAGGLPKHVACHRAAPDNVVLRGLKIDPHDKYTFCIALEEMSNSDMPISLVLGCAPAMTVKERASYPTVVPVMVTRIPEINRLRVTEVRSNITSDGVLTTLISVTGLPQHSLYASRLSQGLSNVDVNPISSCYVVLAILSRGYLVAQKDTPCQPTLEISMDGFIRGPYEVCAKIFQYKNDKTRTICVVPQVVDPDGSSDVKKGFKHLNGALIGMAVGLMVMVVGLTFYLRKIMKRSAPFDPSRCLRQEPVQEENARANYVMLASTATSKV